MVGGGVTGAARARLLFPFACPSHALPRPRARRFEEADGYYSELKDKYNVSVEELDNLTQVRGFLPREGVREFSPGGW